MFCLKSNNRLFIIKIHNLLIFNNLINETMVKKTILFLTLIALASLLWQCGNGGDDPQPDLTDTWVKLTDLPSTPRNESASFVINGKAYIVGGFRTGGTSVNTKELWQYDATSKTWIQKKTYPGGASGRMIAFVINNKAYVGLGQFDGTDTGFRDDFWEYDPTTDTWTQKAGFLGKAVEGAAAFAIGGKGYVCLGRVAYNTTYSKTVHEYNPANNTWTKKNDFPGVARSAAISFVVNGSGYVGLGGFSVLKELWQYNPTNDTWTQKANYPGGGHWGCFAFSSGTKAYVGAGLDYTGGGTASYKKDFYEYNPTNDSWTKKEDYPLVNYAMTGFWLGDRGYVFGGQQLNTGQNLYSFKPTN
jgi:N-acetylneuraminic acid mutarotase